MKIKRQRRFERQQELLKEFAHQVGDFYEEKKVDDKWYVKMFNGNADKWQVAVYSNDSFRRYKQFTPTKVSTPRPGEMLPNFE